MGPSFSHAKKTQTYVLVAILLLILIRLDRLTTAPTRNKYDTKVLLQILKHPHTDNICCKWHPLEFFYSMSKIVTIIHYMHIMIKQEIWAETRKPIAVPVRKLSVYLPGSRRWRFGDPSLDCFCLIHVWQTDRRTELRWLRRTESSSRVKSTPNFFCHKLHLQPKKFVIDVTLLGNA